jgi:hypothetical protein
VRVAEEALVLLRVEQQRDGEREGRDRAEEGDGAVAREDARDGQEAAAQPLEVVAPRVVRQLRRLLGAPVDVADERDGLRGALLAHHRVRHLAHAARDGRGGHVRHLVGAV